MCYQIQLNTGVKEIAKRFKKVITNPDGIVFSDGINGFAFEPTPIITIENPALVSTDFSWGLIPAWSKDDAIKKNTLNAKIETLSEKPSFRDVISNRCLVLATGYYEWRWNDAKGKSKDKYEIHSAENEIFTFAGIYSIWRNPHTGFEVKTFSIITTQANETMSYVHNMKKRMPIMLRQEDESSWLDLLTPYEQFSFPNYDAKLIAIKRC